MRTPWAAGGLFITATDTGAGKTYVAAQIIRALRADGVNAVGFKPLCCGSREDAEILRAASGPQAPELNAINPVWLRPPAAPYVAAMIENRIVDLALVRDGFAALKAGFEAVVTEGVGGWMVPIERRFSIGDLAAEFALPVAVVVENRLGAINHATLTVQAIRRAGLTCAGLIINRGRKQPDAFDPQDIALATNRAVLEDLLEAPVLAELGVGETLGQ